LKKMRRNLLVIAGLALVCVILAAFPQTTSALTPECPMNFACNPDLYTCCCMKGLRCDLTPEQCTQWCEGALPGGGGWGPGT
jgi:hypothetical protein